MQRVTLGGDRLGSGKKQKVALHGFERSTHDLSYLWRSTMSAGTLVPFMTELTLPGDTFDIRLNCDVKTHPTIGPLFGSYKVQLDVFYVPIRLYHSGLHNNMLGIGLNMATIKLPKFRLAALPADETALADGLDNFQINPSCIFSYLGIRGVGIVAPSEAATEVVFRKFNAIPFLAYWEIYKQYYSNKQEEEGAVIHSDLTTPTVWVNEVEILFNGDVDTVNQSPLTSNNLIDNNTTFRVTVNVGEDFLPNTAIVKFTDNSVVTFEELTGGVWIGAGTDTYQGKVSSQFAGKTIMFWDYIAVNDVVTIPINIRRFPLENIDTMRQNILAHPYNLEFDVNSQEYSPYDLPLQLAGEIPGYTTTARLTQEGLALKTYQSDLFNNWLSTDWIDGTGGINEITAIDTSGGSFSIDTLNLSKKVYEMLNRIAVSGGTYDDWLSAVYDHESWTRAESPVYMGGLIRELVFAEVISNSQNENQPLGTLAGRGVMGSNYKGGEVIIRSDEPGYIMGIVSLTPRLDYSQGNKWDTTLDTLDDIHKPNLDEIGFQELITEQMAWWTTRKIISAPVWEQKSAGKQPAWINYMTNVNQVRGNFAIASNEMFMTLNRKYEPFSILGFENFEIGDLTTYIDPSKFNHIFAQTSIDSQNFWVQISCDITARRKMSAKVMPNL